MKKTKTTFSFPSSLHFWFGLTVLIVIFAVTIVETGPHPNPKAQVSTMFGQSDKEDRLAKNLNVTVMERSASGKGGSKDNDNTSTGSLMAALNLLVIYGVTMTMMGSWTSA